MWSHTSPLSYAVDVEKDQIISPSDGIEAHRWQMHTVISGKLIRLVHLWHHWWRSCVCKCVFEWGEEWKSSNATNSRTTVLATVQIDVKTCVYAIHLTCMPCHHLLEFLILSIHTIVRPPSPQNNGKLKTIKHIVLTYDRESYLNFSQRA